MPKRVHYADTGREMEYLINRLVAEGDEVETPVNLGHKWMVLSTRTDNKRRVPSPGAVIAADQPRETRAVGGDPS